MNEPWIGSSQRCWLGQCLIDQHLAAIHQEYINLWSTWIDQHTFSIFTNQWRLIIDWNRILKIPWTRDYLSFWCSFRYQQHLQIILENHFNPMFVKMEVITEWSLHTSLYPDYYKIIFTLYNKLTHCQSTSKDDSREDEHNQWSPL